MRNVLLFVGALLFTSLAFAGFRAFDGSSDLKIFDTLTCSTGLNCSRSGGKLNIAVGGSGTDAVSGFLQNQIASSATTLTAAQCGSTILGGGVHTMNLPEASTVLGCRYTFLVTVASALTVNPDDADNIYLLTNTAGDAISADAIGESVTLEACLAAGWCPVGAEKGTWSDVD